MLRSARWAVGAAVDVSALDGSVAFCAKSVGVIKVAIRIAVFVIDYDYR
jgi:hypothetical protein